jgi:hypothetical protein
VCYNGITFKARTVQVGRLVQKPKWLYNEKGDWHRQSPSAHLRKESLVKIWPIKCKHMAVEGRTLRRKDRCRLVVVSYKWHGFPAVKRSTCYLRGCHVWTVPNPWHWIRLWKNGYILKCQVTISRQINRQLRHLDTRYNIKNNGG